MYLGFMKYYHQAYTDLISESDFSTEEKKYFIQYIKRYFDHVELGFAIEWAGLSVKEKLEELQKENRGSIQKLALISETNIPLSICFLDVDGLKKVNDTYGHNEGVCLLNFITASIKSFIRENDTVSSMGEDEFLIIFPSFYESDAQKVIFQIINNLENYNTSGLKPYKHSFSYGILEIDGENELSENDIIKAADKKMYQNKLLKMKS